MKTNRLFKLFAVIGIGFLLAGIHFYERTSRFIESAREAPGVVVTMERRAEGRFSPVVEWTDHEGIPRTLYSSISSRPPRFFKGEEVTVLYEADDPKYPLNARINSTMELWGVSIFFLVFGAFWLFVTLVSWYVWSKGGIVVFGEENYPGRPDPDFPDR